MDRTIRRIADYAVASRWHDAPADVVVLARRHLLDTVGCAIAGSRSEQARIALSTCPDISPAEPDGGAVIGRVAPTTPELAAFANTCMIRSLDYNDWYPRCHPSDMVGALLAVGGHRGVTGSDLLHGLVVAYETCTRVADAADLTRRGWDHGYPTGIGTVAGLGAMLSLPVDVVMHALSIVSTASVPMRSTRRGRLSLWKGAATAFATSAAVLAVRVALAGMSGPDNPIEGRHGLWDQVTGPFELADLPTEGGSYTMHKLCLKYWPVEFNGQASVWAAIRLAEEVALDEVADIRLGTHWSAWHEIGNDEEKWDPTTRETADHSMPYLFVKAMTDREITDATFAEAAYTDPALRPQMARISVSVDPERDAAWPSSLSLRCVARTRDGRVVDFVEADPKGTWRNPMSDHEVATKFASLATPVLGTAKTRQAQHFWESVETRTSLAPGLEMLV